MKFKKCDNCDVQRECERLIKEHPHWENRFICPLPAIPTKKQIAICKDKGSDYWKNHTSVEVSAHIAELGYGLPRKDYKSIPYGAEGRRIKSASEMLFDRSMDEQRRQKK